MNQSKESTRSNICESKHPLWHNTIQGRPIKQPGNFNGTQQTLDGFSIQISRVPSIDPWYNKIDGALSRAELQTVSRTVTNQYRLNQHLNRFDIVDSPLCVKCGAYGSVDHVLFDCPFNQTTSDFCLPKVNFYFRCPNGRIKKKYPKICNFKLF